MSKHKAQYSRGANSVSVHPQLVHGYVTQGHKRLKSTCLSQCLVNGNINNPKYCVVLKGLALKRFGQPL